MTRCPSCNGIMKPNEKACYGCGERTPKQQLGPSLRSRWATLLTVAFFGSLALTVASLVVSDYTPPFIGCLTASIVILFLRRASDQFTGAKQ
jgi:hypothetical protein